jgi:hypothetical protein
VLEPPHPEPLIPDLGKAFAGSADQERDKQFRQPVAHDVGSATLVADPIDQRQRAPRIPGSGLWLAVADYVAAAHDETAEAAPNDPRGLLVRITVPAAVGTRGASDLSASVT